MIDWRTKADHRRIAALAPSQRVLLKEKHAELQNIFVVIAPLVKKATPAVH
jgi:hypothetical protein